MIDSAPLWNFDDPSGSERLFRAAAASATGADRLVLLTQVARALGLQDRFAEGHATLDALTTDAPEVGIRISLERGRLFRSAGEPDQARPCFEAAVAQARSTGADALLVDGLPMVSFVSAPDEQAGLLDEALDVARSSADPAARRVDGSAGELRIARWMVAWALRNLGRTGEALAIQRELKVELLTAGEVDPYVDEELDLLAPTDPPS